MGDMLKVIARDGVKVPRENQPRKYVTADAAVLVADSVYYRRRLADGDLLPAGDDVKTEDELAAEQAAARKKAAQEQKAAAPVQAATEAKKAAGA